MFLFPYFVFTAATNYNTLNNIFLRLVSKILPPSLYMSPSLLVGHILQRGGQNYTNILELDNLQLLSR